MLINFIIVFFGGGIGALLRYSLTLIKPDSQSVVILLINILGSFLIGIFSNLLDIFNLDYKFKILLITGFLGGFTTFSSFSFDIVKYIFQKDILNAVVYPSICIFLSILFCYLGYSLSKNINH